MCEILKAIKWFCEDAFAALPRAVEMSKKGASLHN
jgi:hypothetical protein